MRSVLIDAGPIVALFNPRDREHPRVQAFFLQFTRPLVSTWPVLTEALHLVDYSTRTQNALLQWVLRGGLTLLDLGHEDLLYIRNRMEKYSDLPMDLADASLMALAEARQIREIISLDADFSIYRTLKGKVLHNLLP